MSSPLPVPAPAPGFSAAGSGSINPARKARVMTQPINQIFRFLQSRSRVQFWLYESQCNIEGVLIGFDEFMNVVVDEAVEIDNKRHTEAKLGRILLKGENITLIRKAPQRDAQGQGNSSTAAAASAPASAAAIQMES